MSFPQYHGAILCFSAAKSQVVKYRANRYNATMSNVIEAIVENGDLHPTKPLGLPEKARVRLAIMDDLSNREIAEAAMRSGAFDFLADPREDIYTTSDGEPI